MYTYSNVFSKYLKATSNDIVLNPRISLSLLWFILFLFHKNVCLIDYTSNINLKIWFDSVNETPENVRS